VELLVGGRGLPNGQHGPVAAAAESERRTRSLARCAWTWQPKQGGGAMRQARFIGIHRTQAAPVIATRRGTQLRLGVRHPNGIGLSHREFAITCASPRPSCAIWRHAASSSFDEDAIHTLQFVNTG
jgi:hypothetical protein